MMMAETVIKSIHPARVADFKKRFDKGVIFHAHL